jgi:glucose-1-phosphate cytidylyltransferase
VKERAQLEEMYHRGNCPWMIWDPERSGVTPPVNAALPAPDGRNLAAPSSTSG